MNIEKDKIKEAAKQGTFSVESAKTTEDLQWTKYKNEKTGHGFSAEDANALNDQLKGKKVEKTGTANVKNGADRIANGTMVQTKYYKSARESVNSVFDKETSMFRYKDQVLEVPNDQYEEAINHMKNKIREGKVPGVKDLNDAEKIIKKGDVTYQQAKNIAKTGNIDSLWFDIKTQSITAFNAFGISFAIQYASCIWNGMDKRDALKLSVTAGVKTGSVVLGAGVITQQFLRTTTGRGFATFATSISKRVIDQLYKSEIGKELIHKIASVMLGKKLAGGAAKNAVKKLLRTNLITATVTTAVMTLPDFYKALVSNKISWKQFSKNFAVNASGVAGGIAGTYGGATIGGVLGGAIGTFIAPGAGTAIGAKIGTSIGGFAGGIGLGMGSAMGSKKLLNQLSEDDAKEMFTIAQDAIVNLATDYMITEDEFKMKLEGKLKKTITPKWLENMYQSGRKSDDKIITRIKFSHEQLEPLFEETIKTRDTVILPNNRLLKKEIRKAYRFLLFQYLIMKFKSIFGMKSNLIRS